MLGRENMKPILFNTEMVRAILDGYKTVTRRLVKFQEPEWNFINLEENPYMTRIDKSGEEYPDKQSGFFAAFEWDGFPEYPMIKAPYKPNDILYVKETWIVISKYPHDFGYDVLFKADDKIFPCIFNFDRFEKFCKYEDKSGWQSPYFMPREAARIFLKVTNVTVERLQDITPEQAMKEGVISEKNRPFILYEQIGQLERYARNKIFPELWDKTMKPSKRPVCGWDANPWVWVIEFERIPKEEALKQ